MAGTLEHTITEQLYKFRQYLLEKFGEQDVFRFSLKASDTYVKCSFKIPFSRLYPEGKRYDCDGIEQDSVVKELEVKFVDLMLELGIQFEFRQSMSTTRAFNRSVGETLSDMRSYASFTFFVNPSIGVSRDGVYAHPLRAY